MYNTITAAQNPPYTNHQATKNSGKLRSKNQTVSNQTHRAQTKATHNASPTVYLHQSFMRARIERVSVRLCSFQIILIDITSSVNHR